MFCSYFNNKKRFCNYTSLFFVFDINPINHTSSEGISQAKPYEDKGKCSLIFIETPIELRKSGILNIKVVRLTVLKIKLEVQRLGTIFRKMSIITIG